LARVDAFHSFSGIDRHQALWQARALSDQPLLSEIAQNQKEEQLPRLSAQESMFRDYEETGFSLKSHPLQFLRAALDAQQVSTAAQLRQRSLPRGKKVFITVAGIAIVRQRPGTAKGIVFLTLEDETGVVNALVRPAVYEKFRTCIVASSTLLIKGLVERASSVMYIHASEIYSLDSLLKETAPRVFPKKSYSY
jgi:error-prone DNA polymerase